MICECDTHKKVITFFTLKKNLATWWSHIAWISYHPSEHALAAISSNKNSQSILSQIRFALRCQPFKKNHLSSRCAPGRETSPRGRRQTCIRWRAINFIWRLIPPRSVPLLGRHRCQFSARWSQLPQKTRFSRSFRQFFHNYCASWIGLKMSTRWWMGECRY